MPTASCGQGRVFLEGPSLFQVPEVPTSFGSRPIPRVQSQPGVTLLSFLDTDSLPSLCPHIPTPREVL